MEREVIGAGDWQRSLAQLSFECTICDLNEREKVLNRISELVFSPPSALASLRLGDAQRTTFAKCMSVYAYESAALSLVAPWMGYVVSKSSSGMHLATVSIPSFVDEFTVEAEELCLGIAGAVAGALSLIAA